jgi:hypothetical protein
MPILIIGLETVISLQNSAIQIKDTGYCRGPEDRCFSPDFESWGLISG